MSKKKQSSSGWGAGAATSREAKILRKYPDYNSLMKRAKRRIPRFAYDYLEGGVTNELCIRRNREALDTIEITPRYGIDVSKVEVSASIFDRDYNLPMGIAPMGLSGLVWPNADLFMAAAAERARIPFILSMVANSSIEEISLVAPNVTWLQLYAVPEDNFRPTLDMVKRAQNINVHALVVTLDTPMRQKRPRDIQNGLSVPFRPTLRTAVDVLRAPEWALSILRNGQPRFANFLPYVTGSQSAGNVAGYVNEHMSGAVTWELVKLIRDRWHGPLVLKGIQHVDDADFASTLGVDGIIVSNHGGRQLDAAPAAITLVKEIKKRVAGRVKVMVDGSIYSGEDLLKAVACGADFVFAGRPFLAAAAALGEAGPDHMISMLKRDLSAVMAQIGVTNLAGLKEIDYRTSWA